MQVNDLFMIKGTNVIVECDQIIKFPDETKYSFRPMNYDSYEDLRMELLYKINTDKEENILQILEVIREQSLSRYYIKKNLIPLSKAAKLLFKDKL